MLSVSAISLSGMNAALAGLGAAAHNIANLGTEGFRRQTVEQDAQATGGVATRWDRAAFAGHAPERDLVDVLTARHAFLTNLSVFRTADAMTGSLLDLRA